MVEDAKKAAALANDLRDYRQHQGDQFDALNKRIDDWQRTLFLSLLPTGLSILGLVITVIVIVLKVK